MGIQRRGGREAPFLWGFFLSLLPLHLSSQVPCPHALGTKSGLLSRPGLSMPHLSLGTRHTLSLSLTKSLRSIDPYKRLLFSEQLNELFLCHPECLACVFLGKAYSSSSSGQAIPAPAGRDYDRDGE